MDTFDLLLYEPIDHFTPQHTAFEQSAASLSVILVTSWFYTVCNTVKRLVNLREKHLHGHELQLSDYNIYKYICPTVQISSRKIYIYNFAYELLMVKKCQ